MRLEIDIRPAAATDLVDAHEWYEARRPGLGRAFLDAAEHTFGRIAETPLGFPSASGAVRRALLTRFPYSVYYRTTPTHIRILAVVHQRRHPRSWKSRTSS